MASTQTRTSIDMFCGAGGFSCGFEEADWRIAAAIDRDYDAAKTFQYNFPATKFYHRELHLTDVRRVLKDTRLKKGALDCLTSKPPWLSKKPLDHRGRTTSATTSEDRMVTSLRK